MNEVAADVLNKKWRAANIGRAWSSEVDVQVTTSYLTVCLSQWNWMWKGYSRYVSTGKWLLDWILDTGIKTADFVD